MNNYPLRGEHRSHSGLLIQIEHCLYLDISRNLYDKPCGTE